MTPTERSQADVVVVGAGLAGLVATAELAAAGRRVILVDQEPEQSLGGQAFWSSGGLFVVDSPEQRRMRIRDSRELAWRDWLGTAGFDRPEDEWPRRWAAAYVDWAAGEKWSWLHARGIRFLPHVGWAERGGELANGPGNSVPRFHLTWGSGPGLLEPFVRAVRDAQRQGLVALRFRHRVDRLTSTDGAITGVAGVVLAPDVCERGRPSSRETVGEFELEAGAVIVSSGGIGGNEELVRRNWPKRLGESPRRMLSGVPAHVDGRMIEIAETAGGNVINPDRMWIYTEGITNWDPIWPRHGIRVIPGKCSLWLDATGRLPPPPLFPNFDTLGNLQHIMGTGHAHTWLVLTQRIIEKEFVLTGSEQNPAITSKSTRAMVKARVAKSAPAPVVAFLRAALKARVAKGAPAPVKAFTQNCADVVVEPDLRALVEGMNALTEQPLLSFEQVEREVLARDREVANAFSKDMQPVAARGARRYFADRVARVAAPDRLLDPEAGPLIAIRLHLLTRKTLGGLQTDLSSRVLTADGTPLPGLYAAGETAGFGGGGMHGYRSLEGTFLGGCLFSGRSAGRAAADAAG